MCLCVLEPDAIVYHDFVYSNYSAISGNAMIFLISTEYANIVVKYFYLDRDSYAKLLQVLILASPKKKKCPINGCSRLLGLVTHAKEDH